MFTQYSGYPVATRQVLVQMDILSRLIWACQNASIKNVRLNLRKKS